MLNSESKEVVETSILLCELEILIILFLDEELVMGKNMENIRQVFVSEQLQYSMKRHLAQLPKNVSIQDSVTTNLCKRIFNSISYRLFWAVKIHR